MNNQECPTGWKSKAFSDAICRYQTKGKKLNTTNYQTTGSIPVVDQGNELIVAYTDRHECMFQGPYPVVVFGDHTRNVKFLDFQFAIGAEGAVLLCPIDEQEIDTKFFYYWLEQTPINNLGYSRHFKSLKEQTVLFPKDINEQRRIVSRIEELTSRANEARSLRKQAVDEADTQLFHVRRKLFEALSKECKTAPLNKCGTVIGGGTPSKLRHDYWVGDIPWISAKEMKDFLLVGSELKISKGALKESSAKLIPAESVLFVVRGSILYRHVPVAINTMPCTINQDMKAILPNKGILPYFLAHMMWGANDILKDMVEVAGNTAGKLETSRWSALEIPVPELEIQRQIVKQLGRYQDKLTELHRLQSETESELKRFTPALLNKAFRGEL